MKDKPIKIAYLTAVYESPYDKRTWSGLLYYIMKALEKEFGEVVVFTPVKSKTRYILIKLLSFFKKILKKIFRKNYIFTFSQLLARYYVNIYSKKLEKGGFDLIIAPHLTVASKLKTEIPIFHVYDATFEQIYGMRKYYTFFSDLVSFCVKECKKTARDTVQNADVLIYSSDWASESAIKDYQVDKNKVFTVPFGANLDVIPDVNVIKKRNVSNTCNLLVFGYDWERKGGDIALDVLNELLKQKINVKMIALGYKGKIENDNIEQIAFLDKNNPDDYKKYEELMFNAHFLLMPTRADCTPIAFSDSAAYGLPVITTDVGGVTSLIKNGINGFALPYEATGKEYAEVITKIWNNKEKYRELSANARKRFEDELNWEHWAKEIKKIYLNFMNDKSN
ncbi:glycosyltransferase family 4 protein [Candidatus Peregrinibacteria bacterium]|nr:glycosyltransferase family 4 protein [Candidatus Peregrinibacteria bacterium]